MSELKDEIEEVETPQEVESDEITQEVTGETEVNSDDKLDTLINIVTSLNEKFDTLMIKPEVPETEETEETPQETEETEEEMSIEEIDDLLQGV